jgi:hypothetical protein
MFLSLPGFKNVQREVRARSMHKKHANIGLILFQARQVLLTLKLSEKDLEDEAYNSSLS